MGYGPDAPSRSHFSGHARHEKCTSTDGECCAHNLADDQDRSLQNGNRIPSNERKCVRMAKDDAAFSLSPATGRSLCAEGEAPSVRNR